MTLIFHNVNKLKEIKDLLSQLPEKLYTDPKDILSEVTIGQHFRHILEFYICLEKGLNTRTVCYDARERNILIETDINFAIENIKSIIGFLKELGDDFKLVLKANYSDGIGEQTNIQSSLFRELAYALDHTVHHMAIVKIALSQEKNISFVDSNFGVAPSTIRYRKQKFGES